ncbi:MAG: hypothetical protein KDC38_04715, partial [Planctomycetes bacterium]|nr:hypothetical protein [Planctomycetota bacterium]
FTPHPPGFDDFLLLRYSPDGTLLWDVVFPGPGDGFDELTDVAVSETSISVVGLASAATGRSLVTCRFDLDGVLLWQSEFALTTAPPTFSNPPAIAIAPDDSVTVGTTDGDHFRLIRYDAVGGELWTTPYDGILADSTGFFALGVDSTGAVAVTAFLGSGSGTVTARYDAVGRLEWEHQTLGAFGGVVAPSTLSIGPDDRIIVTSGHETTCGLFEYRTLQLSPSGILEWEVGYHGPTPCSSSDPLGNAVDGNGRVYVTGSGVTPDTVDFSDLVTVGYDALGSELWVERIDLPSTDVERATAIGVDRSNAAGGVYTSGVSVSGIVSESVLVRYDPDGAIAGSVDLVTTTGFPLTVSSLAASHGRIAVAGDGITVQLFEETSSFIRADCNGDGAIDIGDAIAALDALFIGTASVLCSDACDTNDDGHFDIADPVSTLAHLFTGAAPPPPPFPACGPDPTTDALTCPSFGSCP